MVNDFELLKNIDILFEHRFILYGAGRYGARTLEYLEGIGSEVVAFSDTYYTEPTYCGYPVIPPQEIPSLCVKEHACVIIATGSKYYDEIEKLLNELNYPFDAYTQFGVISTIQLNILNSKIRPDFRDSYLKRKEVCRKISNALVRQGIMRDILLMPSTHSVFVFQVGKVGSISLVTSLRSAGVYGIHLHRIINHEEFWRPLTGRPIDFSDEAHTEFCIDYVKSHKIVKIITLVREPISRDISQYFQYLSDEYIHFPIIKADTFQGVTQYLEDMAFAGNYGIMFEWFDHELKPFTGIDIFDFPFDKENGYGLMKKGNFEILVLKLEMLSQNQEIIGEFMGIKDFHLTNDNLGEGKNYRYLYNHVKQHMKIPKCVVDRYYKNNKRMDYFYTEEEKAKFLEKYNIV